jgi:hypothetical protein
MKNFVLISLLFCFSVSVFAQDKAIDKAAIKNVIQTSYVEGLQNEGDAEKIEFGFHEHFHLIGIGENEEMWHLNITDWKARQVKKREEGKLPKPKEEQVNIKFLDIDITGSAAVAKIEFYVGAELRYIDYIALYKFDSGWKMVNKIFYKIEG